MNEMWSMWRRVPMPVWVQPSICAGENKLPMALSCVGASMHSSKSASIKLQLISLSVHPSFWTAVKSLKKTVKPTSAVLAEKL